MSASTPSSSSALPGVSEPSALVGCTANTFGNGLHPHARERTVLYVAMSNPMRNAAVVNRSLSSGPAGMPNGRSTGMPKNDDFAGEAASPAGTSPRSAAANSPNGPRA